MRGSVEGSAAAAETTPAAEVCFEPTPSWEQWDMQTRRMHKKRQRSSSGKFKEGRGGGQGPPG